MSDQLSSPSGANARGRHRELEFRARKEEEDRARHEEELAAERQIRSELEQRARYRQVASRLAAAREAFDQGRGDEGVAILEKIRQLDPDLERTVAAFEWTTRTASEREEVEDRQVRRSSSPLFWIAAIGATGAAAVVSVVALSSRQPVVLPALPPAPPARQWLASVRLESTAVPVVPTTGVAVDANADKGGQLPAAPPSVQVARSAVSTPTPSVVVPERPGPITPPLTIRAETDAGPTPASRTTQPSASPLVPGPITTEAPIAMAAPAAPPPPLPTPEPAVETASNVRPMTNERPALSTDVVRSPGPVGDTAIPGDDVRIRGVLNAYARAYDRLDARAARAVWPTVDERALARAFSALASQGIDLGQCDVTAAGSTATANCRGTATYVPKVGRRDLPPEPRRWQFTLRKSGNDWTIASANTAR